MTFPRQRLAAALKLYAVTDDAWLNGRTLAACVEEALAGGATFVQLRQKGATTEQLTKQARQLIPLCQTTGAPFVVNDDVQAALVSGADGVHVGQSDTACADARAALGPDAIVGVSVQTVDQALAAQAAGADYLGVGALFATPTKPDAEVVPLPTLRAICRAADIPVVAIGGLDARTIPQLAGTGVAGAAVVSAIFAADDIEAATHALSAAIGAAMV